MRRSVQGREELKDILHRVKSEHYRTAPQRTEMWGKTSAFHDVYASVLPSAKWFHVYGGITAKTH